MAEITQEELNKAKAEVPSGTATFAGTMTTVTPAAAVVGLGASVLSKYHVPVDSSDVMFAMVIVTALAHGIKQILSAIWPNVFGVSNTPKPVALPPPPAA